jgi:signal transduction histidine kinase
MSMRSSRSVAILRSLAEISERVLAEHDLPELYDRIVQIVLVELPADSAALQLWDGTSGRLSVVAVARTRHARPEAVSLGSSLAGWVATRCEALILDGSTESPDLCTLLQDDNVRAAVGVPLIGQGRVLGALTATSQRSQATFSIADRDLLALLASQTAITIERVQVQAAAVRDRDERQQNTEQLVQAEKLASMGRLVAAIAHEINNPLHAIHNSLHLLQSRPLTEEKRERYLGMTQEQVERLIALVQRILNFYQSSRDGMRPTALHPMLTQVLRGVSEQAEHSGIIIERDWAQGLPRVLGVATHLRHVFQHLTLNAIEAMPQGGHLVVRTRVAHAGAGAAAPAVQVEFSDDGPGIPDSEILTIFEPFYTTKRRGTGLGLAISYSIVERHGGMLSVRSGGEQTTFLVTLPALAESSTPAEHGPALAATQRVEEQ